MLDPAGLYGLDTELAESLAGRELVLLHQLTGFVDAGQAYETSDGVYFSPEGVADYGLLARQDVDSLKAGARVEVGDVR